ncbi:hypothetical protein HUJ04_005241 [Dendroctonus ponderosae]
MNCCVECPDNGLEIDSAKAVCPVLIRQKIPRPPNAFMLYANEHRKTLAHLFPADSNKEISRRLGQSWKDLNRQEKSKYFQKAKDIDHEHKRKYPGYVYNPKDARMRKAIRTNLRDRSVGASASASPMLSRPSVRLDQSLLMGQRDGPMWNGLCDLSATGYNVEGSVERLQATKFHQEDAGVKPLHFFDSCVLPIDLIETSEEKMLFEKEKASLEAAESCTKVGQYEELMKNRYLPISTTEFNKDPELFTNNADYHKEYIIKYFNHIPDYETYDVTTEDGFTFPYVTIPNLIVRQNGQGVSYN